MDPNRSFDGIALLVKDEWFLLNQFLEMLPRDARSNVHSIKMLMLLVPRHLGYFRKNLYDIASKLPALQSFELEITPRSIREPWSGLNIGSINALGIQLNTDSFNDETDYFLGPVMAFADASINIVAVNKLDIEPVIFERVKFALEVRVWKQLLPLRMKRDRRKIARIKRKLETFQLDTETSAPFSLLQICDTDGI